MHDEVIMLIKYESRLGFDSRYFKLCREFLRY